jgi:drug/metabolite transporter (DMT)-like permease
MFGCIPALVVLVDGTVPPLTLLVSRSFTAVLLLGLVVLVMRWRSPLPTELRRRTAWRGFLIGLVVLGPATVGYYLSFTIIDTSVAVAISYVYPTLVVLGLAAYYRARPARPDLLLGLCALAGVGLLTLPGTGASVSMLGVALALLTAAGYALYVLLASFLSRTMDPIRMALWVTAGTTAAAVWPAFLREGGATPVGLDAVLVVVSQALLFIGALGCFYAGLRRLGAARASLLDTGQPLVAAAAGALLLGERLLPLQLLGVLVITSSVAGAAALALRRESSP